MRLIGGYMNTRANKEDFALTPYIFGVFFWGNSKIIGLGICWCWFAVHFAIAFNYPKELPSFKVFSQEID
jgi:hypothetical protein